jgi:hypothetical protein
MMANLITGLFDSEAAAENAVSQLKQIGYQQNEISIIMKDRNAAANLAVETGSRTMEGVGTGAAIGGTIGAVLAGLLAVGSVTIPGVGLIAAGPVAAMLAGAGAGSLAGSLLGWLVGAGIPEDVAPYYERGLTEGGVVVAVAAHPGDEARVQQILQGGSVAYAGSSQGFVAQNYVNRYSDLTPPARVYDSAQTTGYQTAGTTTEAQRTANSINAEQWAAQRTAEAHERAAHRESHDTNIADDAVTAVENTADNTVTAMKNQTDKVATGTENTVDRVTRP